MLCHVIFLMLRTGMKRMVGGLFLALGVAAAHGDSTTNYITNLTIWAQDLKFSLSGS